MWIRHWGVVGAVWLAAVLAGCGDDKGSSASDSSANSESGSTTATGTDSEGSATASMSATEPTEGGGSVSMSGTTDISGSMSDSETMGGGGSGNETDSASGTTGEDSQGGTGGSTTTGTTAEPVDCAEAKNEDDCIALGCMPVNGQQFEFDGAIWCLNDQSSFLGCIEQMACDQAIAYICKGQNKYQVPNGCWPNGYQACDAPTDPNLGFPPC